MPIASCPAPGHHWKEPDSLFCAPSLQTFIHTEVETLLLGQPRIPLALCGREIAGSCWTWPLAHSCIAHEVPVSPFLQPVQVPQNGSTTPWCSKTPPSCGCAEDVLCPPGWWPLTGRLPQGSGRGLALFSVFISDLDAGVERILIKSADETKLGGAADSLEGWEALWREDRWEHCRLTTAWSFQRKMPHATPGREQCQTQTQAGEQLGRKGPMDVPGQQAQHKPAACPGSWGDNLHFALNPA